MHVLEVRNDELMDSITRQAVERGITYATIGHKSPRRESADPDRDAVSCPSRPARNEDSARPASRS